MVKNTKGGKHHKKGKKRREDTSGGKIVYAEQNQIYAAVSKKVGGSRILVNCSDTIDRSALIPGKMFKKVWLNEGDILLCERNPNDDTQCYILQKYSYKDASLLKSQGLISFAVVEDETNAQGYDFADKDELEGNDNDYINPNQVLDINNISKKGLELKAPISDHNRSNSSDSDDDADIFIEKNKNRETSTIKSTKWTPKKEKETADTKVYTIDDL